MSHHLMLYQLGEALIWGACVRRFVVGIWWMLRLGWQIDISIRQPPNQ